LQQGKRSDNGDDVRGAIVMMEVSND